MTAPQIPANVKKLAKHVAEPFEGDIDVWTPQGDDLEEYNATPSTLLIRAPRSRAELPEVWGITPLFLNGKLETYWVWNTYTDMHMYRQFSLETVGDDILMLREAMTELTTLDL